VPFAATWGALQAKLAVGTTISNWTAAKGFLGDSFTVTGVTTNPCLDQYPAGTHHPGSSCRRLSSCLRRLAAVLSRSRLAPRGARHDQVFE